MMHGWRKATCVICAYTRVMRMEFGGPEGECSCFFVYTLENISVYITLY